MPKIIDTMVLNNERYIEALKVGDRTILQQIYAEFSPAIIRLVMDSGGTRDDARDVFQSALVILFERVRDGALQIPSSFGDLLLSICRRVWRTRFKADTKSKAPVSPDDLSDDIEEDINSEEKNLLFRKHFKLLGAKCQMLLAFFFAGHTIDIICEQMGHQDIDHTLKRKDQCKEKLVLHIKNDPQFTVLAS